MRGGLRVYTDPAGAGVPVGVGVFYSRRLSGPFYRWCCAEEPVRWRSNRVHPSASAVKAFQAASWKAVPPALRAKLDEHYLE